LTKKNLFFLVITASAILGGIISSIMIILYPYKDESNNKPQTDVINEPETVEKPLDAKPKSVENEEVVKKTSQKTELTEDDQAFDFDNNGYVDFGEFLIAFWIKAKGSVRNKLVWLFDVYDIDKSGFISMTELTHMLRLVFSLKSMNDDPVERAQYVMGLVDCNSDGQLSRLEFVEGCMMDDELRELLET